MILLKKDRLIKAISLETGGAGAISCLDEYGNVLCAKGGGVFLDLSRGFTMARVGKGSSTSRSTDVEDLRELIRKAARTQDLLARAGSLVSADDRFSVVDSPFSNTIWVRSKGDTEEMPLPLSAVGHGSSGTWLLDQEEAGPRVGACSSAYG